MVAADDLPGIVAILTLGVGLLTLFAGVEWFWMVFVLGWVVLTPLTALVFGDDDKRERWAETGREDVTTDAPQDREEALDLLRERYARGDLDDVEFERKVERLLATETLAEAERVLAGSDDDADGPVGEGSQAASREHDRDCVR